MAYNVAESSFYLVVTCVYVLTYELLQLEHIVNIVYAFESSGIPQCLQLLFS